MIKTVTRSAHEQNCLTFWDAKRNDIINLQPGDDGYFHSHFSVVPYSPEIFHWEGEEREQSILRELHRMENVQVDRLIDLLGPIRANQRVHDSGSGRGGTALRLNERHGCLVQGTDFCPHRLDFARKVAEQRGVGDKVTFHHGNMTDTGLPAHTFDFAINNEAQEHLESMAELCAEIARLLRPGGKFVVATWVANDPLSQKSPEVAAIDAHYITRIHTRGAYIKAMTDNRLAPLMMQDLTAEAVPYFELRDASAHRTGVEQPFLRAFRERLMNYLFIVAEYQPDDWGA